MTMWQINFEENSGKKSKFYQMPPDTKISIYLTKWAPVIWEKVDPVNFLLCKGCYHILLKIFSWLDSSALFAAALVSRQWQNFVFDAFLTNDKFRRKVERVLLDRCKTPRISKMTFELKKPRAAIIDAYVDEDFNLAILATVSGSPHVFHSSIFTKGRTRWIHRFRQYFDHLTCISSGNALVALGSKSGKIYVYENVQESTSVHMTAILAHHSSAVHKVIFYNDSIITCSDDMTVGLVSVLPDGALLLTKILQGHVSRIRTVDAQDDCILSGSDDRSVKLWSANPGTVSCSLSTMCGHSGPISKVILAIPIALSASGSSVRIWNVKKGTCLKLLQHSTTSPITSMALITTFRAVATIDAQKVLRTFKLDHLDDLAEEIILPSSSRQLDSSKMHPATFQAKLNFIPHQFTAIHYDKVEGSDHPSVHLQLFDYASN